jgi:hypothetical protein
MRSDVVLAARFQATRLAIPLANILACIDVESGGVVDTPIKCRDGVVRDYPVIRFEGHYFYKRVNPSLQAKAIAEKLAAPVPGAIANPSSQQSRWDTLEYPAQELDMNAAIESTSWGVGQVMGANWQMLGLSNAIEFLNKALSGVSGQISLMFGYIEKAGLVDELQRGDFAGFARGYNGPANVSSYASKLASRAKVLATEYPEGFVFPDPSTETMLRMGTKGALVRAAQELMLRSGIAITVDGDFGPATKSATISFQMAHGLHADGLIGPKTWAALDVYRTDPQEHVGALSVAEVAVATPKGQTGSAVAGAGVVLVAAKDAVSEAARQIVGITATSPNAHIVYDALIYGGAGLTLLGAAIVAWTYFRSTKTFGLKHST